MKKIFGLVFASLILFLPVVTLAAEFRTNDKGSVGLRSDESAKNLYAAGTEVIISGETKGDLTTAGETLNISGPIESSLLAAGNSLNIQGSVGKNARVAGNSILIGGSVGEDLFAAGATLSISKDAVIGGDLFSGVNQLVLDGTVQGKMKVGGEKVTINGKVDGDTEIYANKIVVGDNAIIGGNFKYHSPEAASISSSAKIMGETTFDKTQLRNNRINNFAGILGFGVLGLIMGLALLFVIVYLLPKTSKDIVQLSLERFWVNAGFGFTGLVVIPIALIILAITVVGLKIAGIILLAYITFLIVAGLFATLTIGEQILRWLKTKEYRVDWLTVLVGSLATLILGLIPIFGGLVIFVFMLSILGLFLISTGRFIKNQR